MDKMSCERAGGEIGEKLEKDEVNTLKDSGNDCLNVAGCDVLVARAALAHVPLQRHLVVVLSANTAFIISSDNASINAISQLEKCCNATQNFIVTQVNTPLGTNLSYATEPKRIIRITENILELIATTNPLKDRVFKHCSVVGNAGVLTNSSCGAEINQADFVFRCNLAPIIDYKDDVGTKTDLVTSNPSIIITRYKNLNFRRRPFVDYISAYKDAFILLSAFTFSFATSPSFKVSYTLQDFGTKQQAIFLNPSYMKTVSQFWKAKGVKERRLSTGFIILSAALEMCEEVSVYGFWPFSKGVHGNQLSNHYYDNLRPSKVHSMPNEFYKILQLHMKGIVKLQADECE
ncbi:alpha-2,8-sialyltransferase 8F-like [Heterodontus francisci]|uniref:alpha-2,8-sialyltransferase 8F-like n=1 Tax=Heterodontus francisci TaxID=7792 RepID=UPI00355BC364